MKRMCMGVLCLLVLVSCSRTPEERQWGADCPPYKKYLFYRDLGLVPRGDGLRKMLRTALDPCATFKSIVAQRTGQIVQE